MFWLTLRQHIREGRQSVLADEEKYQMENVPVATPTTPKSLSEMLRMYTFSIILHYFCFFC